VEHKKIILFTTILLFLLISVSFLFAQELQVKYPELPGIDRINSSRVSLPILFTYIYTFSIITAGILAFILIIWGGIKYISNATNPGRMSDAKEQIGMAFLGLLLILGAWMIVNTINPDLTALQIELVAPESGFKPAKHFDPLKLNIPDGFNLFELPIGSLITSEFKASSFLTDTEDNNKFDIDYAEEDLEWPPLIRDGKSYDTDFQGALYGARLKRIVETADTALQVITKLKAETESLSDLMKECQCHKTCNVISEGCNEGLGGKCSCDSGSDICSKKTKEKLEEQININKHLSKAYAKFLNASELVEDYYNNNQSEIDDLKDNEAQDLIELMIEVENKGGYSPSPDPLERDIGTQFWEIDKLLSSMENIKEKINPYNQEGFVNLMTFAQAKSLEQGTGMSDIRIRPWQVAFLTETKDVDVKKDPATFYTLGDNPMTKNNNIIYAKEEGDNTVTTPDLTQEEIDIILNTRIDSYSLPNSEDPNAESVCTKIVEIPIGTALDEAIKLTSNIRKELLNIYKYGYAEILKSKFTQQTAETVKDMNCKTGCLTFCLPSLTIPVPWPPFVLITPSTCIPRTNCRGVLIPILTLAVDTADSFSGKDGFKGEIEDSYRKLTSEDPIGKDYFCTDENGICRDNNGRIIKDKIKKHEYTLKEKLIEVQMLLNKARGSSSTQTGEKGIYEELLEEYVLSNIGEDMAIDPGLELAKFRDSSKIDRIDLQTCSILFTETGGSSGEQAQRKLFNCRTAEDYDTITKTDREICSTDPYLDREFFFGDNDNRIYPLNCYCYDKDTDTSYYNKEDFPGLYASSIDLGFPNINDLVNTFYDNQDFYYYDDGVEIEGIDDISNKIDHITADLAGDLDPQEMFESFLNINIKGETFMGLGNNYYCCIR